MEIKGHYIILAVVMWLIGFMFVCDVMKQEPAPQERIEKPEPIVLTLLEVREKDLSGVNSMDDLLECYGK